MRRLFIAVVMILPFLPVRAEALTIDEIIELTRAGLTDDVLVALIEVDDRVFAVDPDTLKRLKAAGVSQRVLVAMVRSGRSRAPEPPVPLQAEPVAPEPQVIVIEREPPVVQQVVVPVPVPVYVPVVQRVRTRHPNRVVDPRVVPIDDFDGFGVIPQPHHVKAPEPVYWGWGGKLRPDAWKPAKQ